MDTLLRAVLPEDAAGPAAGEVHGPRERWIAPFPSSRDAILAGLCLCASLLTELTYGVFLLLLSLLWLAFTPAAC